MHRENTFQILQQNVRKRGAAVQLPLLCDPRARRYAVIALQEHWRNACTSQSYSSANDAFHMVCPDDPLARVCLYVNKDLDLSSWRVIANEADFQTIEFTLHTSVNYADSTVSAGGEGSELTVLLHNIYNPCQISYSSTQGDSTLPRLREALETQGNHIVVGDFNLHHPYWGGTRCVTRHAAADQLLEIVSGATLDLLLPAGTITREQHQQRTTIDLVWASLPLANRMRRCGALPALHQGSYHLPIETIFDLASTVAPEQPTRRSWKKADPDVLSAKLKEYLPQARSMANTAEIDAYTNDLIRAITQSANEATPERPTSRTYARAWWTPECTEAVQHARTMRAAWLQQGTETAWTTYTQATDRKGKIIASAKRAQWRALTHESSGSQLLWKLSKWGRLKSH